MDDLKINIIIRALFFGIGTVVAYSLVKWAKGYVDAKRKQSILEIDIQSRTIHDNVSKLSDDELIKSANDRAKGAGNNSSEE